ncbi:LytTR family DNA-binding domain-containing protein [Algoriella sp.]|uniref:LytR/AlgR family response regulator transcription factor n=1 Tax=Algoriella sp. TaxID=1872434 RepID=UPI001B1AB83D|nr:response regulator [Algoriella sp.]MBO6212625.1 response regulator [Algoriella sp.]
MKLSCITIDDEPFALKLISSFVEKNQDLEMISSFNSAKNALKFLENNLVDCIFLDVEMPDLNGVEFAKILAKKNQKS